MNFIDREKLLAARAARTDIVDVSELIEGEENNDESNEGGEKLFVMVKELPDKEFTVVQKAITKPKSLKDKLAGYDFKVVLAQKSIVNSETMHRMFTEDDLAQIAQWPTAVLKRITETCFELNGYNLDAVGAAEQD